MPDLRQPLDARKRRIFFIEIFRKHFPSGERRRKMFSKKTMTKFAIVVAVVLFFCFIIPHISVMLKSFVKWASTKGSHITFISLTGAMILWASTPLPGFMFLCFGAGFLYGVVGGFFLAWVVALIGIAISFPLYRYCCGKQVLAYLGGTNERTKVLLEATKTNGFKIAVLMKMLPFTGGPANVLFAVCTPIPLLTFMAACAIGHIKFLLYTFVGAAATSLTESKIKKKMNKEESARHHLSTVIATSLAIGALLLMIYFGYKMLRDVEKEVERRKRAGTEIGDGDIEAEEKKGLLDDADSI